MGSVGSDLIHAT